MALGFGGDWKSDDEDDGPLGISGAMKESIRNDCEDMGSIPPVRDMYKEDPYPEE